ncbi:MAG TPA: ATP-binding protein [Thermoanaerobaculia bacterium]|nr:ATP-binding protein [Thermoanaerobaculia bacterium]
MDSSERRRIVVAIAGRISRSIGAKLFTLVFLVLLLDLGLIGYASVRLHRQHLESETLRAAGRMSNVIGRSVSYYMLRNERDALEHTIETIGREPGIVVLRVFNPEGRISFSTNRSEVGRSVSQAEPACVGCHKKAGQPVSTPPPDRLRIFRVGDTRVLGVVSPIPNAPSCSSGACHAHPATQRVLGVLETNISLATADADLASASRQFIVYSALGMFLAIAATILFLWRFVLRPVKVLHDGTERLGRGELGVQIPIESQDELGELAGSFNDMSRQILDAREETTSWARTLEQRVTRKTAELRRAHDQMLQAEKLASLGKLAAVVAHEINNPLSGILTYARLIRKWIERGDTLETRAVEMADSLRLIESESRRCGDIVRNLLTFARVAPMNIGEVDVNAVIRQTVRLVEHKLDLGNVLLHLELAESIPKVRGDTGQVEQLLLALIMNAIEAMPHDGNLSITTAAPDDLSVVIVIEDNGIGIPEDLLPRLFDPFVTTKEEGKGVGLGLAISRSIVERHEGKIEVKSQPGRGTAFTITLPTTAAEAGATGTGGLAVAGGTA